MHALIPITLFAVWGGLTCLFGFCVGYRTADD